MITSSFVLIFFACVSSLSRGVISVIDRYQMGYRKQSSINVNFLNNIWSALLVTIFFVYMILNYESPQITATYIFKMLLYAFLAQIVAFGYSYVYKKVSIMQAVVLSKLSDLFIPIAIFMTMGYFSAKSYMVSIISTVLVVVYIFFKQRHSQLDLKKLLKTFLVIAPLLIIQAALSPLLTKGLINSRNLVFFTIGTIYVRCIITVITYFFKNKSLTIKKTKVSKKIIFVYSSRAILTLLAQVSYTLATSSSKSSIAWVFLNMTSLFSVFFGSLLLKENADFSDFLLILAILVLAIFTRV